MSSGSDDEVVLFTLVLFALPLIYRLVRLARAPSVAEMLVCGSIAGFCTFCLTMLIDCGDLAYTATVIRSPGLAGGLAALPLSVVFMVLARLSRRPDSTSASGRTGRSGRG